jgi:hypothetical protein
MRVNGQFVCQRKAAAKKDNRVERPESLLRRAAASDLILPLHCDKYENRTYVTNMIYFGLEYFVGFSI